VSETEEVPVTEGVRLKVALGEAVGLEVAVKVCVGLALCEGDTVGLEVAVKVCVELTLCVGEGEELAVPVDELVGEAVRETVGVGVAVCVPQAGVQATSAQARSMRIHLVLGAPVPVLELAK
jgi:hypothetical protein